MIGTVHGLVFFSHTKLFVSPDDKAQSDCGTHHAPPENKNEYRIEYHVQHRTCKRGDHSKSGAAVRTDNWVHRLPEHIKRDTQRYLKSVC